MTTMIASQRWHAAILTIRATKERTMSQNASETRTRRNAPTSEHKKEDKPIFGVSPDDGMPVTPPDGGTGKPGGPEK